MITRGQTCDKNNNGDICEKRGKKGGKARKKGRKCSGACEKSVANEIKCELYAAGNAETETDIKQHKNVSFYFCHPSLSAQSFVSSTCILLC